MPMKTLLVGYLAQDLYETLRHGRRATAKWLDGDVVCHTLDIYHRHALEKVHHVRAVCAAHLPDGDWDVIRFKAGPKRMSGELALDLLQEAHILAKKTGAKLEVEYEGRERDRNLLLDKIRDDPDRVRDFSARWKASVPGIEPVEFVSVPGCFCHRRSDDGGLALAEVVSRELNTQSAEGTRLLDMGCGCGLVGILVAKAVPGTSLVMVDSHSRAVEAATLNAKAQGVEAEVILADNGAPARMNGTFDVFAGNPPYYSDYRIAEVFLETAARALRPGGVCYTVCKNAAGLKPVQEKFFRDVDVVPRRGYSVLRSVKGEIPC